MIFSIVEFDRGPDFEPLVMCYEWKSIDHRLFSEYLLWDEDTFVCSY